MGIENDLSKVMVAQQVSSLGFQMTLNVRNKALSAYKDIMNMPVWWGIKEMASNSKNPVQGARSESRVGNWNFALQGDTMFSKLLGIPYQPAVIRSVPLVVGALLIAVIVAFFSFAKKTNVMTIYDNLPP